ncbi:MAG: hypothetical protein IJZ53_07505 [Tyzzerella sp.]|nr:hypothetical protein [Tyzzerella sp.]
MSDYQGCNTCKHTNVDAREYPCNECKHAVATLDHFEPMTNADRIRNMTDEELADILLIVSNFLCNPSNECIEAIANRGECLKSKECALKWLQAKVKDGVE